MILLYALGANIIEEPERILISAFFIGGMIAVSLVSRGTCTTKLRVHTIEFDEAARRFITDSIAFTASCTSMPTPGRPATRQSTPRRSTNSAD